MPLNSYLQDDESYTEDQGWLIEQLPDKLTDDMERNSRHDFRRHPDDPQPTYAIITDIETGKRSIAEFQHVPYTSLDPKIICTLEPKDDPGHGGHLIPIKNGFGLWFVLVGGNLKKMVIYHAELDDYADWETLKRFNGEDGTPPRPIEFGAAHLYEIENSDYYEKCTIYFVGGYGKYEKGDFGKGPLTTRRDILMLELELDCFMKTYPPTPTVRGAKWTSFDCIDVARLVHKNPNYPLSVGSFSMTTNRPNMHQKRKSKRIHQKIMTKSSKALVIMGDSDEVVMIPVYDLTGATNFFHYHPSPDAHDDLVSCTIPYRQFLEFYGQHETIHNYQISCTQPAADVAHMKVFGMLPINLNELSTPCNPCQHVVLHGQGDAGQRLVYWFYTDRPSCMIWDHTRNEMVNVETGFTCTSLSTLQINTIIEHCKYYNELRPY